MGGLGGLDDYHHYAGNDRNGANNGGPGSAGRIRIDALNSYSDAGFTPEPHKTVDVFTPFLGPSPTSVPAPAPTPVPTPVPSPVPAPVPSQVPTPSPAPAPTPAPTTGACFHGDGTVLLESGSSKRLSGLSLGDRIKTSDGQGSFSFSPVLTLPHANNSEPASFLTLTTETGKVVDMTSDHFVPKCDLKVITADELAVGDCLLTIDGKETLMEISSAAKMGVFTAITQGKFIVVNGVVASAFSKDSDPAKPELDYIKYKLELEDNRNRKLAYRASKLKKRLLGQPIN